MALHLDGTLGYSGPNTNEGGNGPTVNVSSLNEFKSLISRPDFVNLISRDSDNLGGGQFAWYPNDTTIPNDGTVIQPTSGSNGRYKRIYDGPINVQWFGAKGNNISDDRPAFSAAITESALNNGGTIWIPAGAYRFASKLTILQPNTFLQGDSRSSTTIIGDHQDDIIEFGNGTSSINFCRISNLRIDGGTTPRISGAGLRFRNGHSIEADHLQFGLNHYTCVQLDGGTSQFIYKLDNLELNNGSYGIRLGSVGGMVQDVSISNTVIDQQTIVGMELAHISGGYFHNISILTCQLGIYANPNNGQYATACLFNQVLSDTCVTNGWLLEPTHSTGSITDWNIVNCWAATNGSGDGAISTRSGVRIGGNGLGSISGLTFEAFKSSNNRGDGIQYFQGTEITFVNCHILCNSQFGNSVSHGLSIAPNVSKWSIVGGVYGLGGRIGIVTGINRQGYGIVINGGTSNNYSIIGADVLGNLISGISDGGTGTNKTIKDNIGYISVNEPINISYFGVKGDGIADDTTALRLAIASGIPLNFGNLRLRITDTIKITNKQSWYGNGAILKLDSTARGYIIPLLNVDTTADFSTFNGIEFDHNASGVPQATLAAQIAMWYQCCVINQANSVSFTNCTVRNAWDSGFVNGAVVATGDGSPGSPFSMVAVQGMPERAIYDNCRAFDCGVGDHHTWGPSGFYGNGFGNGGSRTSYSNCIAKLCYGGIANEFGATASAIFVNCIVDGAKKDSRPGFTQSPGNGFWLGDGPSTVTNCVAMFCDGIGFTVPDVSSGSTLTGCYSYANGQHGFVIGCSKTSLSGCIARSNSQSATGTYAGFHLDSAAGNIDTVTLTGCVAADIGPQVQGYGLSVNPGAYDISAVVIGCTLKGTVESWNIGATSVAIMHTVPGRRSIGINSKDPLSRLEAVAAPASYLVSALGNGDNPGTLAAVLEGNIGKRLAFAYDGINDCGVIQSNHSFIMNKPTLINPSGGDVMTSKGAWDAGHLRLGAYHIWIDSSGRLRIKNSAPSNDTDGTVVGTQS